MAFNIITDVLIVLAGALLVGEIFEQLCLPSSVGEILAGMIIGPSLLGIVAFGDDIFAFSSIALFFIIFHIGFEMKIGMVRDKLLNATLLSITSFVIPFIVVAFAALVFFPFGFEGNLIIALAISIPSISIVSVLVLQYRLFQTATGQTILAAVTISDVLAFVILAGVVRPLATTLTIIVDILLFVIAFVVVDWILNRKPESFQILLSRISKVLRREDFSYVFLIIVALAISAIFQVIGLSYILGAFFAGLIVHDGLIGRKPFERISQTLSTMNRVFFIPLFFGFAGLEVSLQAISLSHYLKLAIILAIVLATGVYLTYYVSKSLNSKLEIVPKKVAGILVGRGAIGIIIATIALNEGSINNEGFSMVILGTLVLSLVIPLFAGRCKVRTQDVQYQNTTVKDKD